MPEKRPFSRINFLSRKAKDERGMASIAAGGEYTIRSKNKIADPTNPSKTLERGSKVKVGMQSQTITRTTPGKTEHEEVTTHVPQTTFHPGDIPKDKVVDRMTTMATGAAARENPEKTKVRMEAQKSEKTSYDFKGKKEYSGRYETKHVPHKITIAKVGEPTITRETMTKPVTTVTKPVAAKSQVIKRKQEFQNTPWTSTKRDTKGFTSNPNSGGRTRVKWSGSSVKVN